MGYDIGKLKREQGNITCEQIAELAKLYPFITPREIADEMNMSVLTIYRYIKKIRGTWKNGDK